ncbi:MAG TPA: KamA family radical SAM protein [Gemmatimonadales bacterium]|nr:KamA family radical SAM protein [Gemmatimonadales bacterium]
MADWQKVLRERSLHTLQQLADKFGSEHFPDLARLQQAVDNFELRISPAMVDLIREPGDPIWRQYVPDLQELEIVDGVPDSLNEDADSPVPNITHRYPDRALFLVSPVCAAYCRFCTRRRKVGDPEKIPISQFDSAFKYLEEHQEIRDVILSGGDPLLLSDRRLDLILSRLRQIKHLEVLRIGSRVPCHLPERITVELCAILKKHHPLYINTHFNHPDELTPAAVTALGMLADAGVPLGCQTVLLRGVNDSVDVMKELMQRLLAARVRPYYIYMCDQVAGAEHFKTTVETGLEIVRGLRGWTSGLAVPHFVIDAPGGGGKIPLLPEYVERVTDDEVVLRNYRGRRFVWRQPREDALVAAGVHEPEYGIVSIDVAARKNGARRNGKRKRA